MSPHASVVAIQGNRLPQLPVLLAEAGYRVVKETTVHTGAEAARLLDQRPANPDHVVKGAYLQSGWTVLLDPELILFDEKDLLARLSKELQANILGWVCEGVSGTYGFTFFNNGLVRSKVYVDGEITEDSGSPLEEESGISWDKVFEDDILNLAERLGVPFHYMQDDTEYHIFLLDESEMDLHEEATSAPAPSAEPGRGSVGRSDLQGKPKKWWQFWR